MKKQILNGVIGFVTVFLIACNPKSEEPVAAAIDKEQIKKEIQAKENEFATVYNGREIKDIGYYADDATTFYQNVKPLVGKQAIVDFIKADMVLSTNKISFTTKEVFVCSDGGQVVELGYFTVVDSTNTTINTGNYMSLFEKRDGKYVCVRDMSASDMEPINTSDTENQ
jgi:ketosteroid isomerase-like protein